MGKEYRSNEVYEWNGLKRSENGRVIFQYTLGGKGAIRIGENTYSLKKGEAFLVQLPSDHEYYLPDDSSHWEFVYMTVYGQEALHYFHTLTENYGHILELSIDSRPIKHIFHLLDRIQTIGIQHSYDASAYAYSFLMECMQYFQHDQNEGEKLPVSIAKAVNFIEQHYQEDLTLSSIVDISGLSKYHFARLFHKTVHDTPIKYLTKIRVNHSLDLLQKKELSIEEVARSVGYTNANYFTKVFKGVLDVTPSEYRNSQSFMPVNQLFLD
ncbi:AraC family transcriptional regulator [Litchfieldia salsa]|uniref:AraC family transcriptional regulator n=1 Tax=Litchfieldia salsa TaxID=930152 RepID=UPI00363C3BEF